MIDPTEIKPLLRAALAHVRRHAGRELHIGSTGVEMVGAFGLVDPITVNGAALGVTPEEVARYLDAPAMIGDGYHRHGSEREFEGLGTWLLSQSGDGTVALKAKKATAPCLEAIASGEPEKLARLRSIYIDGAVDVYVVCEGKTRARETAMALVAERKYLGLPTTLDMPPDFAPRSHLRGPADHQGPEPFDAARPGSGTPWVVTFVPEGVQNQSFFGNPIASAPTGEVGRIFVAEAERGSWQARRIRAALDTLERPSVLVEIALARTTPTLTVDFSAKALAMTTTEPAFDNAPWDVLAARRAARAKGRPPAPKTWHGSTELVAEAYVAREAPRGYVSDRPLYFHGPVAYSQYDGVPIAAFVDVPDGVPTLFFGHYSGLGGGQAAVATMAMGDIDRAAGDRFRIIRIDDFGPALKVGGMALHDYARTGRVQKNEAEGPRNCSIDEKGFGEWFSGRYRKLLEARNKAYGTKVSYATLAQYRSEEALMNHALFRDRMASMFDIALPDVGSSLAYSEDMAHTRGRIEAREAELEARRAARDVAAEPAEDEAEPEQMPAPRM